MSVVHRSLIVWAMLTSFCALVAFKLDGRLDASWFLVFSTMYLLDVMLFFLLLLQISAAVRYNQSPAPVPGSARPSIIVMIIQHPFIAQSITRADQLVGITLKVVFQILLCIRLDSPTGPPYIVVFIPLWLFMITILWTVTKALIKSAAS